MHIRAFCFAVPLLALIFATCNSGTSDSRPGKVTARASAQSAPPLVYTCLITRDVKGLTEFYERVLRDAAAYLAQTEEDATRLRVMGAPEDRVEVIGNLKYDSDPPSIGVFGNWLAQQIQQQERWPVLVAGSVVADEELLSFTKG